MRILFTIGNLDSGGAEKVVATLANSFAKDGFDVGILLVSTSEKETFFHLNEKISVIPLLDSSKKVSIKKKTKLLAAKIKSFNPDIVISFLNYVIFYTYFALRKLKKDKGIKFIVSERNNPKAVPESWLLRRLRNHIFKKADGCVFQTKEAQSYFKKIKKGLVIPNPVFLNNKSIFDYKNDERKQTILMVGSDKPEKNRSMAFKAFALFKKTHPKHELVIVGSASNAKELDLLDELNIENSVRFVGKSNNWHEKFSSSEMFILTSDFEGMPNALLEACALQIPCISTNCPSGGPKEILNDGKNGVLVNVGDYNSLAMEMSKLADSKQARDELSLKNKKTKIKYSSELIANKWIDFIKSLL